MIGGGSPQGEDPVDDRELHATLRILPSESRNPATQDIDTLDALGILRLIHAEDRRALDVVEAALPEWSQVVDAVTERLRRGGRLFYAGAGTSGRLGVLDAAECPPTYSTSPGQVVGLIAGGHATLVRSQEGVEDRPEDGARDVDAFSVAPDDALVALSASRRTPYALGAMQRAHERGAWTCFLAGNRVDDEPRRWAHRVVEVVTGPEAITGSTRMKAALAQKMMLTMLSTAVMVRLGKVYGNLMVDVAPTSQKLRERAKGLVMDIAGIDYDEAAGLLSECGDDVKAAIVMSVLDTTAADARERLAQARGILAEVIGPASSRRETES